MKTQNDKKLDNPVWFSLSETHQSFLVDYGSVKFYHPDYCPFGGFEKGNTIAKFVETSFFLQIQNLNLERAGQVLLNR